MQGFGILCFVNLVAAPLEKPQRARVLGMPIDLVTMASALDAIESHLSGHSAQHVVTADSSGLYLQTKDSDLARAYQEAALVTPDSIGVVWAIKRQGYALSDRVSGVELVDQLTELSAKKGYRLFFLGAEPGVAERAAEKMRLKHPGCNIVGTRDGYFKAGDDAIVASEVATYKPDILFVAMGIPRQEKFILKVKETIGAKVSIGVGGSFDVFSGKTKRAPKFIQRVRCEWLWRVILNPRKISKVAALPKFAWAVIRSKDQKSA